MPNINPIRVNKPAVNTPFDIPAASKGNQITLTIKIDLNDPAWLYQDLVIVFLNGKDIYAQSSPAPVGLKLGTSEELNGKKLLIKSNFALLNNAGSFSGTLPVYTYTLSFDDGATNIGTFTAQSVQTNPTRFNSTTIFNQL